MLRNCMLISLIFYCGCSKYETLNIDIFQAQKSHINISPYKAAKGMRKRLTTQLKFRESVLVKQIGVENLTKLSNTDTIYILENFSETCENCPSNKIQILMGKKIIDFHYGFGYGEDKLDTVFLDEIFKNEDYQFYFSALMEIWIMDRKKSNWTKNTLKYGSNNCLDGGHTFITVIYPSNDIKSIYVRCWITKEQRE